MSVLHVSPGPCHRHASLPGSSVPSLLTRGTSVDLLCLACRLAYALLVLGHSTHYWETRAFRMSMAEAMEAERADVFEPEDLAASELFPYLSVCGLGLWGPFMGEEIR